MKYYCCGQIRFLTFLGIIVLAAANLPAERQPGFPLWSIRFTNLVADVLVDGLGNSYLVGSPNSGYPMNVVKVAPSGQLAWSVNVDDRFIPSYPRTAVTDPLGNLYVGGATFAPSTNPARPYNYEDFATAKFSPAGQLLWRVTYDPPDETTDYGNGIGRDLEGNLYVVGRSFEPNIPGAYDTVLKYDRDGHLLWARRFEPATNSSPNNVGTAAVNPLGGVAAVGNRTVASYSANGDLLWSWQGAASDVPAVFDHQSHLYIISSRWNGRSFESALIKFSPTGEVLWTNWYQSPPRVEGGTALTHLSLDSFGNAYVAGDSPIACRLISDDGETELRCDMTPLIVKFSPDGRQLWATRFLTPENTFPEVSGLALGPLGEPHLAVRLFRYDTVDDGYYPNEALVAKCDTRGNQIWAGVYTSSDTSHTLFFGRPQVDRFGHLFASAELIDYRATVNPIDTLLLKFQPEQIRHGPDIFASPRAQTAARGATVTFRVSAGGVGRFAYQWRFNSRPIPGATGAMLMLSNVQSEQAGDYSVEVRNHFGTVVTPEARLIVLP